MTRAKVSSYVKRSPRGKPYRVISHVRTVRSKYNIEPRRQLPHINSSMPIDEQIKALKPGKRTSASGNTYYERRFNRSDQGEYL